MDIACGFAILPKVDTGAQRLSGDLSAGAQGDAGPGLCRDMDMADGVGSPLQGWENYAYAWVEMRCSLLPVIS